MATVSGRRVVGPGADSFALGVTVPDATNTGVLAGVTRTTYGGPTSITGSSDSGAPTLIENKDIASLLTIASGYVRFYNCHISGGPGTFNTGQVDCRASGVLGVEFERCTFDPGEANTSYWLNAVIGHHMTVHRCHARRVVDFVGSYNTYASRTDNVITGNFVEYLVRYDVDEDHADGTHNDAIQHQGGLGLTVIGNALHGYTRYEDGTTAPADPWNRVAQGVLVQENVAIGGVYYCGEILISNNWISGFQHPLVLKTRSATYTAYDASVLDNLWLDADQRDYGGSYKFYNIRLDLGVTLLDAGDAAVTYPVGATLNTEGNVYEADVPTYGGQAVYVRRDNLYGG